MQDKTKFYNVVLPDTEISQTETQNSFHTFEVLLAFEALPTQIHPDTFVKSFKFLQLIQLNRAHQA